jgi:dolichol-phosphate mannosyltransferase
VPSSITVVLPTYNERENLPKIVDQLLRLDVADGQVTVLVVDDDSPDGTGKIADALAEANPGRVRVLHRTVKDGLGRAYLAGFAQALSDGADVVVQMDADLSHPVSALPAMVAALGPEAGVVLGSCGYPSRT